MRQQGNVRSDCALFECAVVAVWAPCSPSMPAGLVLLITRAACLLWHGSSRGQLGSLVPPAESTAEAGTRSSSSIRCISCIDANGNHASAEGICMNGFWLVSLPNQVMQGDYILGQQRSGRETVMTRSIKGAQNYQPQEVLILRNDGLC